MSWDFALLKNDLPNKALFNIGRVVIGKALLITPWCDLSEIRRTTFSYPITKSCTTRKENLDVYSTKELLAAQGGTTLDHTSQTIYDWR